MWERMTLCVAHSEPAAQFQRAIIYKLIRIRLRMPLRLEVQFISPSNLMTDATSLFMASKKRARVTNMILWIIPPSYRFERGDRREKSNTNWEWKPLISKFPIRLFQSLFPYTHDEEWCNVWYYMRLVEHCGEYYFLWMIHVAKPRTNNGTVATAVQSTPSSDILHIPWIPTDPSASCIFSCISKSHSSRTQSATSVLTDRISVKTSIGWMPKNSRLRASLALINIEHGNPLSRCILFSILSLNENMDKY